MESVAWISERKDVLSTFFWFLAVYAYVRYTERPDLQRYLFVVVPLCLGLMAKPMLVTFPFTLLLLDIWPLRRFQFPGVVVEKIPMFALSAAVSTVTYLVQQTGGVVQSSPARRQTSRNALGLLRHLHPADVLAGRACVHAYLRTRPSHYGKCCGRASVFIAGVSAIAVATWRTRPYFAVGWFWYLGTLVPVIGLVQVGIQSHADRYMYVPMVGLTIALSLGCDGCHPEMAADKGVRG